jgi:hypothetical protein
MPKFHHPTNAVVKDVRSFTSTPPNIFFYFVVFNQTATGWRFQGSNNRRDNKLFSTNHPDRPWGPNKFPFQWVPEFLHVEANRPDR